MELHIQKKQKKQTYQTIPIELIDSAGQDLRQLFSDDRFKSPNLTNSERDMLEYIQSSKIIVLVVNLKDYSGEEEYVKRKENERVLTSVVQMFTGDGDVQDILVAFTAYDQYRPMIKEKYGSFGEYVKKELTHFCNVCRVSEDRTKAIAVAAVGETEVRTDKDGEPRRKPKKGFKDLKLSQLTNWVRESVAKQQEEQKRRKAKPSAEVGVSSDSLILKKKKIDIPDEVNPVPLEDILQFEDIPDEVNPVPLEDISGGFNASPAVDLTGDLMYRPPVLKEQPSNDTDWWWAAGIVAIVMVVVVRAIFLFCGM
jgi:hypothetical protein